MPIKDFKIYFATNDKKRDQKFIDSIGLKVELVDIADFKYVKVLATSKYLINNSSFKRISFEEMNRCTYRHGMEHR